MNPSKMRDTYGKMMFILQDTETHIVKSETGLSFIKDILTVTSFLHEKNGLALLNDPLLDEATCSINNTDGERTREELQTLAQQKQDAINTLVQNYTSGFFFYYNMNSSSINFNLNVLINLFINLILIS